MSRGLTVTFTQGRIGDRTDTKTYATLKVVEAVDRQQVRTSTVTVPLIVLSQIITEGNKFDEMNRSKLSGPYDDR